MGALFLRREKKKRMDSCFDAFLKCEKMALVGCDTNYYYWALFVGGPIARAFLALWSSRPYVAHKFKNLI